METIIIILGLVAFVDQLLIKWSVWYRLEQFTSKQNSKFLHSAATCRFCLLFHLGLIVSAVYGLATGFNITLYLTPFVVSGLLTLSKKL